MLPFNFLSNFLLPTVLSLTLISTVLFFVVPYLFLHWSAFKNRFLFSGVFNYPAKHDKHLAEPARLGLSLTENYFLEVPGSKGKIGLWVINPTVEERPEKVLIFYCHGASNNRGKPHRVEFYRKLQHLGYTTITFDYRGFGDSKGARASEGSTVRDCRVVYEWVTAHYPEHRIVVWGHSLGTGISTRFLSTMLEEARSQISGTVVGLILESAFISAREACKTFPAAKYWDYFRITRDRIPRSMDQIFPTVDLLPVLPLPVHLIHAVDDRTIPLRHSEVLREACEARGKSVGLYAAECGEHRFVHRDPGTLDSAGAFIRECAGESTEQLESPIPATGEQ